MAKESARNEKIAKKSLKAKFGAYAYAPKEPMHTHCHALAVSRPSWNRTICGESHESSTLYFQTWLHLCETFLTKIGTVPLTSVRSNLQRNSAFLDRSRGLPPQSQTLFSTKHKTTWKPEPNQTEPESLICLHINRKNPNPNPNRHNTRGVPVLCRTNHQPTTDHKPPPPSASHTSHHSFRLSHAWSTTGHHPRPSTLSVSLSVFLTTSHNRWPPHQPAVAPRSPATNHLVSSPSQALHCVSSSSLLAALLVATVLHFRSGVVWSRLIELLPQKTKTKEKAH
ncbi:hypothetical protein PIB30_067700 [Stylosanthes scabra]|uniref:Uncharacterized protein n=1 Tax=Stylosanthes scabra TaxID=79078 RepID=A0ABU6YM45_9FABA|nr:hypothetical protein [Stylosanthes scabra]